jgi:hypothetical protein
VDYIVLLAGALIESVKSLFEFTDFIEDFIIFRQSYIDVFFNISIKEGVLNV